MAKFKFGQNYFGYRNPNGMSMMQEPAPKSPARLSKVIVILAIVTIAAVAGVYYLNTVDPFRPFVSSVLGSTETGSLQLDVSTNSSLLTPGSSLGITLSVENTATQPLNVSERGNWTVIGFPVATDPACIGPEPIEFMVVSGDLSLSDLRQESVNSSYPSVMCMEGGSTHYFLFEPDSSIANLTGFFCTANCYPSTSTANLTSSFSIRGYWAYPLNSSEANDVLTPASPECYVNGAPGDCVTFNYPEVGPIAQHPFVAGTYTMVVTDEWNQTVLLHFSIPPTSP